MQIKQMDYTVQYSSAQFCYCSPFSPHIFNFIFKGVGERQKEYGRTANIPPPTMCVFRKEEKKDDFKKYTEIDYCINKLGKFSISQGYNVKQDNFANYLIWFLRKRSHVILSDPFRASICMKTTLFHETSQLLQVSHENPTSICLCRNR